MDVVIRKKALKKISREFIKSLSYTFSGFDFS